ncbi:MAG: 16S rRNA (adenine(1518)-N(6)/adenine(1519)-N(6))-dimethyltransferase RsmA [Treponema sp.]|nr:16S rRNA (adenine(1518)-N(6)/adenine(1519)-N(6))-dimethyltransferase RsmA [Treponema sp.]
MRKKYGQNFLINPGTRQALADALGAQTGDAVWEIGPGLGAMTVLLLEKGLYVRAFEIDPGFSRVLRLIFSEEKNFFLVEGDVMKTWSGEEAAQYLLGNLPYSTAAALLAGLIEKGRLFARMVVTVQKEVALRMAASAGMPEYSSFSVLCASVYHVTPLMLIKPSSFYPKPNVDSIGVLLEKRESAAYPPVFYPLVRSLFASKRKTVKNNLTDFFASRLGNTLQDGVSARDLCASLLSENGLCGKERAQELGQEVFLALAKSVENMQNRLKDVNRR